MEQVDLINLITGLVGFQVGKASILGHIIRGIREGNIGGVFGGLLAVFVVLTVVPYSLIFLVSFIKRKRGRLQEDQIYTGEVTSIEEGRAFINVFPDKAQSPEKTLLSVRQIHRWMAGNYRRIEDMLKVGDSIEVKVLTIEFNKAGVEYAFLTLAGSSAMNANEIFGRRSEDDHILYDDSVSTFDPYTVVEEEL